MKEDLYVFLCECVCTWLSGSFGLWALCIYMLRPLDWLCTHLWFQKDHLDVDGSYAYSTHREEKLILLLSKWKEWNIDYSHAAKNYFEKESCFFIPKKYTNCSSHYTRLHTVSAFVFPLLFSLFLLLCSFLLLFVAMQQTNRERTSISKR